MRHLMKLKKLSLLAGALCRRHLAPLIAVAFSITPLAANAQVNSNAPQRVAQAKNGQGPQLNLSSQQKEQLNQIRSKIGDQIQAVLTDDQRKKIQDDLKAGKPPQQVFASIQFTEPQKVQLQNIWATSQKQMIDVLNPQQKETLEKWYASQRNQRQRK